MNSGNVILWEWVDARGDGVMSVEVPALQAVQKAKLEERLDRLEELKTLSFTTTKGLVYPWKGKFKKIKISGNVALRPILVFGPKKKESEITFLLLAEERDNRLLPLNAEETAENRLQSILANERRRKRYDRD